MPIRSVDYRVDVLRNGVPWQRMTYASAPSVYCSAGDEIPLTFRGEFRHIDELRPITDELQPVMILDGAEYPLGVYRIGSMSWRRNAAGVRYDNIVAYDRGLLLRRAALEHREFWPAGTRYLDIVQQYLTRAGIRMAIVEDSDAVLQTDREDWDIGTPYLTIVNALLGEITYNRIWFDLTGAARIQRYRAPSAATLQHQYREGDQIRVLGREYCAEMDIFDAPNVFIAVLENPEYPEPIYRTAVNDSPASQISTISQGLRIPKVLMVDNIADEAALQDYVNRVRDESMRTSEYVTFESVNLGTHGVGDVIGLQIQDLSGIFREVSWNLSMQVGAMMQHRAERVVII